jgi:myo-inositol-1(or 4)-monophosphatase
MLAAMFSSDDLAELRDLLSLAANDELIGRYREAVAAKKRDGSIITEADLAMQRRLQAELAGRWPAFLLLGEEMPEAEQQALLTSQDGGLWCLDPLDGTGNFAAGIPFFAVSLALLGRGGVQAAVVLDPVRGECFSALAGQGAWLNNAPLRAPDAPASLTDAMAMVDLKRLPAPMIRALAAGAPYRSQRSFGSVALDWCWIACGRCQVYLHGGQKLWDYAAGSLILAESGGAGGLVGSYDGDWVDELTLSPRIAIAATHDDLLVQWRAWIAGAKVAD